MTLLEIERKKGFEQGFEKGLEQGRHQQLMTIVHKMLAQSEKTGAITALTGISYEEIEQERHERKVAKLLELLDMGLSHEIVAYLSGFPLSYIYELQETSND